jgi:hypothetical protein
MCKNTIRAKCYIGNKSIIDEKHLNKCETFVENFREFSCPPKVGDFINLPLNVIYSVKIDTISHTYDENGSYIVVVFHFNNLTKIS